MKYTHIELFAGAGGLALGLEQAGLHSIGAFEWDKHACQTLRDNRPEWNVVEGDLVKIAEEGFGGHLNSEELDVLSGWAPCQAFSHAGKRLGMQDTRGTLFHAYAKALEELQPKVFIFENVKGLLTHDNGFTFNVIVGVFETCGYKLYWDVLNANDYGVAQKRERLIIVGIRNDLINAQTKEFKFKEPQANKPVLKDALKDVPVSAGSAYSEEKKSVMKQVPAGGNWKDLPDLVAREYMKKAYFSGGGRTGMAKRLSWELPAPTLTTSPSQKQTERCHPDETRPLQVREYARIQSFPDDWSFSGGITAQYKQIVNAVPVNLAKHIGDSVVDYLDQFEDN